MSGSVTYLRHCLVPDRRAVALVSGPLSVRDLDPGWQRPYIALLNGEPLLRADWVGTVVCGGDVLIFVDAAAIPQGGGGSSNPLNVILSVVVVAAAVYTGGLAAAAFGGYATTAGALAGGLVSAGVMMAGGVLVNALAPPRTSSLSSPQVPQASPTYNLQAQGNTARIEGAIPEQFGRHMSYPDYAAMPYQEYIGNEQYLYSLLCLGRGQYDIEGIYIEDTPITNFQGVNIEVVPPGGSVTLFPAAVTTSVEVAGQDMEQGVYYGPFVVNDEGTSIDSIGIDYVAGRGLFYANDNGGLDPRSVSVVAEAQRIDDDGNPLGDWFSLFPLTLLPMSKNTMSGLLSFFDNDDPSWSPTPWPGISQQVDPEPVYTAEKTYTATTTTPQRYSEKFVVPAGRYQVRSKRTSAKDTNSRTGNDFAWVGLRGYHPGAQAHGDVTVIAIRMQATAQLSTVSSRKIRVVAVRKLPIWNGSAWTAPTATRSIAWAFAYACKACGIPDSRIDLATLLALDGVWTARGDQCNGRVDSFLSLWDVLTKIGAAGRAKPYMQGGIIRLFRDQPATIPVALFSMRNIVQGSFSVQYLMPTSETADAADVGYFDARQWVQRRVRAALPGTAAKPVKMELSFVTSRDQAYREGMYTAACNRYRRRIISFQTELDGFIPSFGDLILIQHDMVAWGQSGEVVASDGTSLTIDRELEWEPGRTHYLGLRRPDGTIWGPVVATLAGGTVLSLASAPDFTPRTGGAGERTHAVFGWSNTWSQRARVLAIKPRGLYSVELMVVNEDDNVHTAETGRITPSAPTSGLPGVTASPAVRGLTATAMPGDTSLMLLAWEPASWADHYVLEASGDGQTWTRIGETRTANYTATAIYGTATIIRVAAVGLKQGDWASIGYKDLVRSAWDPTISGLRAQVVGNVVEIAWDQVADWNVAGYELRVGSSWDDGLVIVTGLAASKFLWRPTLQGPLKFWLKAVDRYGVYSIDAASYTLSVIPARITSLSAKVIDNNVLLYWQVARGTFEDAPSEVRRGIEYENSELIGIIDGTFATFIEDAAGTYKYWIVPIDSVGLRGEPVGVYAVINQPPDYVLYDRRPLDFNGTMVNVLADRGIVYAPVNTAETFEEHFVNNEWSSPQDQINADMPYFLQPALPTADYNEVIDYGAVIDNTAITLSITREAIVGEVAVTPTISYSLDGETWTDGVEGLYQIYAVNFRYVRVALHFDSPDHGFLMITDSLVQLDVKAKTVTGTVEALATDTDGTVVDITGKFIDVQNISMTVQGLAPSIPMWDFVDVGNPSFFKVLVFNPSGERINGTVHYIVRGV